MVTAQFSEESKKLQKRLEPYLEPTGGLKKDAPPEAKKLLEEFKRRFEEEMWLD